MERKLFNIGRYWLLVASVMFAVLGITLAVSPDSPLFDAWINQYQAYFAPLKPDQRQFLSGPLGATIFGFYTITFFVALIPLREREHWAWLAITFSLLAWFSLDTAISASHGAWFNIKLINLTTLVIQGIPLVLTFPAVFHTTDKQVT